eukprot:CAMPEP_0172447938 /NCGR_PEP_ID=MMETSP1065-20121228/7076_1 /TAXON_ID=265537 /ORGANISM="Amphiprora paludosa, Strain CCMP125" /LENGTH=251 /DNA_ID=CAMNT_0013199311 /DNA_START=114 /DNA_END=869 /DNA_ORIENTATION=-
MSSAAVAVSKGKGDAQLSATTALIVSQLSLDWGEGDEEDGGDSTSVDNGDAGPQIARLSRRLGSQEIEDCFPFLPKSYDITPRISNKSLLLRRNESLQEESTAESSSVSHSRKTELRPSSTGSSAHFSFLIPEDEEATFFTLPSLESRSTKSKCIPTMGSFLNSKMASSSSNQDTVLTLLDLPPKMAIRGDSIPSLDYDFYEEDNEAHEDDPAPEEDHHSSCSSSAASSLSRDHADDDDDDESTIREEDWF